MSAALHIAAILALIALAAFFAASEMAYSSLNRLRLESLAESGDKRARVAVGICSRFEDALSTILIGNSLANIGASSLTTVTAILFFGTGYTALCTAFVTLCVIVFGETMPKILAKKNANRFSLACAYYIRALMVLFWPVVFLVGRLVKLITGPMRDQPPSGEEEAVEELSTLIETSEDEGVLDENRSELLQAALDFSEVSASEVMTSRVDMTAIDIDDSWEEILETVDNAAYSRIPVYEDSVDNVIGVLSVNRLYRALIDEAAPDLRALLMEPCYVYKTLKLPDVLGELRRLKTHLAVVTDEYGGSMGVITMEDVLEELVGEIWDETDEVVDDVVEREDGVLEVDGDMSIGGLLEFLDRDEDSFDTDSATVGGWTLERFGGFPQVGDSFTDGDLTVTVLEIDGRRVEKVLIRRQPPQ